MSETSDHVLYEERLRSTGLLVIFGVITGSMALMTALQVALGPLGTKPAPTWVLAALTLLFACLMANFAFLTIRIDDAGVSTAYGIFSSRRAWSAIASCEIDDQEAFYGWGIRFGPYKKKWLWIYNVMGGARVVLLTSGTPRSLMFSTRRPEVVIELVERRLAELRSIAA